MSAAVRFLSILVVMTVAGCGSSGSAAGGGANGSAGATGALGGGGGAGHAGATGGAGGAGGAGPTVMFTWKENGIARLATSTLANRYVSGVSDSLTVLGTDIAASATVSFVVSTGGGSVLGGSYACGVALGAGFDSAALGYDNQTVPTDETCAITISFGVDLAGLPHVSGTFQATLPGDGGTVTLTEGQFDLPVTQTGS